MIPTPHSIPASPHEISRKGSLGQVIFIACVAALGGFLFGYDSGCINGTVAALQKAFNASSIGSGFNVASILLGCAVGVFVSGRLADRLGRKPTLILCATVFALGAWGAGIASGSLEFVIYRLIGGLAVGAASVISPAYISEIAPAAYRGRLATLQQLAIVLGLLMAFLVNYLIAHWAGGASAVWLLGFEAWQWMFWAQLVPIAFFALGLLFIPESPRFLVAAGRHDAARKVLARLSHPDEADSMLQGIRSTLKADHRPSFRDLLKPGGGIHPIIWIGMILAALQQLTGINVVFYYGEVLWKAAGFTEADALKINVITGMINVSSTFVAIALVDKWGRRPLLLAGSIGMTIFLGALAAIFGTAGLAPDGALQLSHTAGIASLILANLYIICFGSTWGPVTWVLLGEMFPNQMRGAALSLAGLTLWLVNFAITTTFPLLLGAIGLGGAYGIYAAFAFVSFFAVLFFIRETKGRALEAM